MVVLSVTQREVVFVCLGHINGQNTNCVRDWGVKYVKIQVRKHKVNIYQFSYINMVR